MSVAYLDTSALGRVLLGEPDARAGHLDAIVTYDVRLAKGAREHGLTVLAPA